MNFTFLTRILFLFFACNVFAQDNIYSALTIPGELKKNANAVVRNNEVVRVLKNRNSMITTENRVVTVFNKKGNRYVQAYSGYDKYNRIKKIEAVIYDQNGKEIKKIKKRDFIDQSAVDGGTLYSDSRVLYMSYVPTSYPYTVSFECITETPNTIFIPSWRPITNYNLSIEKDKYTIIDEAELQLNKKEKNFDGYKIKKTDTGTSLSYLLENISAIKPEQLSPIIGDFTPHVMFNVKYFNYYGVEGQVDSWQEFGDWMYQQLLKGRNVVSSSTKQEILNLVKGVDSPIERARLVYNFVQENTRYISVQVGIGGNQPIEALEVDKLKYGDCKGLTNYTQALMEIAGVKSYYTVVQAGKNIESFDDEFPTIAQGNHIILAIENGEDLSWVDCTTQVHPFGFVGDFTDNRKVLLVKPGDSKIVKTPAYLNETNGQQTSAEIQLFEDGNIQSKVEIKTTGIQYDSRFWLENEDKKTIKKYYKNYWDYIPSVEIVNYSFNNNKDEVIFTEVLELNVKKYTTVNEDGIIFKPNFFNKNLYVPSRYRNRKTDLSISRGYLDNDVFIITIPENFVVEGVPENVSINNKYGTYNISYELKGDSIIYKRELLIKSGEYSVEDYALYRKFRRAISKNDNAIVVLKKKE